MTELNFISKKGFNCEEDVILTNYGGEEEVNLKFIVTGGHEEKIELRVCYADNEPFEASGREVVSINLVDILKAASEWGPEPSNVVRMVK